MLRAEHHKTFLDKCPQAWVVLHGLKLKRHVHSVKGEGLEDTSDQIENILKTTENDILDMLVTHYQRVT